MMRLRTGLLLLGIGFAACNRETPETNAAPLMTFDTARVRLVKGAGQQKVDTIQLVVELARTSDQKTMGLMERTTLADSAGMLFIYDTDQPATAAFWMFRTRIPLDIAFIDSAGVIRSIQHMIPCTSATAAQCPNYPPGVPYRTALEVTAGYFAKHGIVVGDRMLFEERR